MAVVRYGVMGDRIVSPLGGGGKKKAKNQTFPYVAPHPPTNPANDMPARLFPLLGLVFVLLAQCTPETPAQTETPSPDSMQATAAPAPSTDIWLVALPADVTTLQAETVRNITARAGYDNQPSFTPEGGAILYTAQHGEQTDIYRYDLDAQATTQLTRTAQSE